MTEFQLQGITTLEDADVLIENAQRKRKQKLHAAEGLEMSSESTEERAARIQAELAVAQAEYNASLATLAVLPEGPTKEDELTKKAGLEYKIRKLNDLVATSSNIYVVEKARDIALLQAEAAALEDFINQVTARKAAL